MLKRLFNSLRVFYSPAFPKLITYMLQACEYKVLDYLRWFWNTDDFSQVQVRKELDKTRVASEIYQFLTVGIVAEIFFGLVLIILGLAGKVTGGVGFGLALIIFYPVFWSQAICFPLFLGRVFVYIPKERKLVAKSKRIFSSTKAKKIVVAGSYGKTTMKDLLATVLKEGKKVAVTPGNKNVPLSHAVFASKLKGDEDLLIIEIGEGAPGDVVRFADTIKPDMAVITGLSSAHLDRYKTIEAAGKDIFSLSKIVKLDNLFINGESKMAEPFIPKGANIYTSSGALGWKVSDASTSVKGTSFTLKKGTKTLKLHSSLIGLHQVGPLAFVAALSDKLGLSSQQITQGIAKTKAYEHRMQPYELNGAVVIDDTYNGNIEGIRVGTELLANLEAKNKIYITPGLVAQGKETIPVHVRLGKLVAKANPDKVILMKNSVTKYIEEGLREAGYNGQIVIEKDPIKVYSNLSSLVASGDLVLMQNDWADNYR